MKFFSNILVVLVLGISTIYTLHLPDYFTPCKKNDPNLNKCALESAMKAESTFINGDKKYKVMNLNPAYIQLIDIDAGQNLKLGFSEMTCSGLDELQLQDLKFDLKAKEFYCKGVVPRFNFNGQYDVNGKILVLPIEGHGHANITFVNGVYEYKSSWNLVEHNGKQYVKFENPKLTFKLQRAYFDFQNLFNGDEKLGSELNKFVNDNWSDVMTDVGEGIGQTFATIFTSVLEAYFDEIPFDEIFID